MSEHALQRAVEILDPVRQLHREDRVRQRRLPMRHQPVVLRRCTSRDRRDRARSRGAPWKRKVKIDSPMSRGSRTQWMILRARQHQRDEAEIDEIARQLVDDARLVGRQRVQLGEIARRPRDRARRHRARRSGAPRRRACRRRRAPRRRAAAPCARRRHGRAHAPPESARTSVVPERGMPTMKTGAGSRIARPRAVREAGRDRTPRCWRRRRRDARRARTAGLGLSSACPARQCAKARGWPFWPDQNLARS